MIVGGPPCQAFARVGRPKLREIDDHPRAFLRDPRARLYLEWLHYVTTCNPLAVLMENVPDALNHGGQNVAEETCEVLEDKGYVCGYTLLNAAYYGVPQMRERLFLIGYRREIANGVTFPNPRIGWTFRRATRVRGRWRSSCCAERTGRKRRSTTSRRPRRASTCRRRRRRSRRSVICLRSMRERSFAPGC